MLSLLLSQLDSGRRASARGLVPLLLAGGLVGMGLVGCEAKTQAEAHAVAKQAARKTEKGMERAGEAAGEAAREAEKGIGRGVEQAREGIAEARSRYEVDAKVGEAQDRLSQAMDETASGLAELAESSKARHEALTDRLAQTGQVIAVAPAQIECDDAAEPPLCRVDPALLASLRDSPMSLARDASVRPKRGELGPGLALSSITKDGFTAGLGLRDGDILLEINGVALSSFDAIRAVDEALAGQSLVTLIYERKGERQTLTVAQQAESPAR